MRQLPWIFAGAAVLMLAACGEPNATKTASESAAPPAHSLPSNDMGNTYPSQTGQPTTTTPGAEGGRSSATTGATPGAPDPNNAPPSDDATPPP